MPGRILVVDAVATNRIVLKVKLSAAFYEVLQAGDGVKALRMARMDQPDLILLDLHAPQIDGIAICQALKQTPETADIPILLVSSEASAALRLAGLRNGAEDYLVKPLDEATLLARVRSLLRLRELTRELKLRGDTFRALGFAEDQATLKPQGRIAVLSACTGAGVALARRLSLRLDHRVSVVPRNASAAEAHAWEGSIGRMVEPDGTVDLAEDGRTTAETKGIAGLLYDQARAVGQGSVGEASALGTGRQRPATADVFVLIFDARDPKEMLASLAELRSRRETRHAAIVVILPPGQKANAAIALDLGATDILNMPLDEEELALRVTLHVERKQQADQLRQSVQRGLELAAIDPLTQLYNRRYAQHHLSLIAARAAHEGHCFAVMILDIDRFKSVNDTWGHRAGDWVLAEVARRLQENLRGEDLIARYGGEEFLIVLPKCTEDDARGCAERLRRHIEAEPFGLPGGDVVPVTLSIGLMLSNVSSQCPDKLLDCADRALYASKADGRNLVTLGN